MPLIFSLVLVDRVFGPGDPVRPFIVFENTGATAMDAPVLDGRGDPRVRLHLTYPDGRGIEVSIPEDSGRQPPDGVGSEGVLAPRANRLRAFSLDAVSRAAGEYSMYASFDARSQRVSSNTVSWFQEQQGAVSSAMPTRPGQREPSNYCFHVFHGEQGSILYRDLLSTGNSNTIDSIRLVTSRRLAVLDPGAHSFAALADSDSGTEEELAWVAWLEGDAVCAGAEMFGFQQMRYPLPFTPGKNTVSLSAAPGGACDVFIAGEDGASVALVRFEPPAPPLVAAEAAESLPLDAAEDEAIDEDQATDEEDGDLDEPLYSVALTAPRLLWSRTFEQRFAECGLAAGSGSFAGVYGLAMLYPASDGIDVAYVIIRGTGEPEPTESIRIGDAHMLPECSPAMQMDASGRAHLALLLGRPRAGEEGERVVVARLSFGTDGRPRLDRGTVYHEEATLTNAPLSGAVSLYAPTDGNPWRIDWCVLMEAHRCLLSSPSRSAQMLNLDTAIIRPITLSSYGESCFILAHAGHTGIRFIESV